MSEKIFWQRHEALATVANHIKNETKNEICRLRNKKLIDDGKYNANDQISYILYKVIWESIANLTLMTRTFERNDLKSRE